MLFASFVSYNGCHKYVIFSCEDTGYNGGGINYICEVEMMIAARFDMRLINEVKDILFRLRSEESLESVKEDLEQLLDGVAEIEVLLIVYELLIGDDGITVRDVQQLFSVYEELNGRSIGEVQLPDSEGHPVRVFIAENIALRNAIDPVSDLMAEMDEERDLLHDEELVNKLRDQVGQLGQFVNHYHRKEKLIFPILERYGYFTLTRSMWGDDDRVRNFYKGTKSMLERIPDLEFDYIKRSYDLFVRDFQQMIFQEETFLLPVVLHFFTADDWIAVAEESDAYGYAMVEPDKDWVEEQSERGNADGVAVKQRDGSAIEYGDQGMSNKDRESMQIAFGGGFLTVKEADYILNNLPVEITFIDKQGVFKYFNDKVKASEMMFVRTPSSIGSNVAHCHPPRNMKKVMQLIRDLRLGRRSSECMWYKKDGHYVHITYKGLFTEDGEYLGILEYVQDIQPFLDLPRKVKKEVSLLE